MYLNLDLNNTDLGTKAVKLGLLKAYCINLNKGNRTNVLVKLKHVTHISRTHFTY